MVSEISSTTVCAFSPLADKFALCTENRLRIWDTTTGKSIAEFVDTKGSVATSLCWISEAPKRKSRKKQKTSTDTALVAVGTSSGEVVIWDLLQGKIRVRLEQSGHKSAVSSITCIRGKALCTSGVDGKILQWNISSGQLLHSFPTENKPVRCVKVPANNDSLLISATSSLKIWDLSSKSVVQKCTGHSTPVNCIDICETRDLMVTSAENDRFVNLWSLSSSKGTQESLYPLVAPSAPQKVAMCEFENGVYHVLGVQQDNFVFIWSLSSKAFKSRSRKPLAPSTIISGENKAPLPVLSAVFQRDSKGSITIATGSMVAPTFKKISYVSENGELKARILDRPESHLFLSSKVEATSTTTVSGVHVASADQVATGTLRSKSMQSRTEKHLDVAIVKPGAELSMEERLKALELSEHDEKLQPTVESIQGVLVQGLQANDKQLINSALNISNVATIHNTVSKLPTTTIFPLLTYISNRLRSKPTAAGTPLVAWLRELLSQHASYLMSSPEVRTQLAAIYQHLDSRLASFKRLLKLHGRVELLLSQISDKEATLASTSRLTPQVEFDEQDYIDEDEREESEHEGQSEEEGSTEPSANDSSEESDSESNNSEGTDVEIEYGENNVESENTDASTSESEREESDEDAADHESSDSEQNSDDEKYMQEE